MTKSQILKKIYPLYKSNFDNFNLFCCVTHRIRNNYAEYMERAFMRSSLRVLEAVDLKNQYPEVALLLCYVAAETLSNNLAYYQATGGREITDFKMKCEKERKLGKSKAFENFFDSYCPDILKAKVIMKKKVADGSNHFLSFKDIIYYLYQKNRCYFVHKGIFRNFNSNTSFYDVFIDRDNKKCTASFETRQYTLAGWFCHAMKASLTEFLKEF